MTTMRAFEVHTLQSDRWRIDSVFDDRALALFEAKRLEQNGRYRSVRVVEEWFDERTNQSRTRSIYERGRGGDSEARQRRGGTGFERVGTAGGDVVRQRSTGGEGARRAARAAVAIEPDNDAGWLWALAACVLGIGVAVGTWFALG